MDEEILWRSQASALAEIGTNLVSLIKAAKETQSRITDHGLDHNYSQNHDCYSYGALVWKNSLRLAELKKLEMEIKGYDSFGRKVKNKGD